MNRFRLTLALASAAALTGAEPAGRIVRLDPEFDRLVPRDAIIEKVADGHKWLEGPLWDSRRGGLLFSDIPVNSVFLWSAAGGAKLFLKPSGYTGTAPFEGLEPGSNGLTLDASGRLVLCEHGDRRIARLEADGRKTTLAGRYEGKRLNSPNDLAYHSNGDLYFTDPPFGLPKAFDDPGKELPFQGVYKLSQDGRLTLLTREIRAPNGIAFSPDERTLYISNAVRENAVWLAFDVKPDGTLGRKRVLFDGTAPAREGKGSPDGMKVDRSGNIFSAGPNGVHVFSPDGRRLGMFDLGVATGNCAWGEDGSVLYIAASTAIYRVRLATRGVIR